MAIKFKDFLRENPKLKAFMIVTGCQYSGKSRFLRTVSENQPIIEVDVSEHFSHEESASLTVLAISESDEIVFWEKPPARRFDTVLEALEGLPSGCLLLVDSRKPETFRETRIIHELVTAASMPCLCLANFPKESDWTVDELKMALRLDTLIPCDALSSSDTRQALIRFLKSFDEEGIKGLAELLEKTFGDER